MRRQLVLRPRRWIPEAARLLRPIGRLAFHTLSVLVTMCQPADGPARPELRPQREVSRFAGGRGVEFHPGHGEWIEVLRAAGLVISGLRELYAPPGATHHRTTSSPPPAGPSAGQSKRSGSPAARLPDLVAINRIRPPKPLPAGDAPRMTCRAGPERRCERWL